MSENVDIPTPLTERERQIDRLVFESLAEIHRSLTPMALPAPPGPIPYAVDLSTHLRFIRDQNGGAGCFGYSTLAVWDIMNEMACPYSPNLSMRVWLLLHEHRELWQNEGGIFTPDGRFHNIMATGPDYGLFQSLGNVTEGTELTARANSNDWPTGNPGEPWTWKLWTVEGINEAGNYRLKSNPAMIAVSSDNFVKSLAQNTPIRLGIRAPQGQGHSIAIVGYDKASETFKFVDSAGDNSGQDGFKTLSFRDIDTKQIDPSKPYGGYTIDEKDALIIDIHPPRPVPAARISFKHTNRSNVHLWLYAENSPLPRNKIWPQGWKEDSRNLSYTVRLPSEFIWPPSPNNRLVLELYDAAEFSNSGGELAEFTAAFGGHVVGCSQLANGPTGFSARQHLQFCIP